MQPRDLGCIVDLAYFNSLDYFLQVMLTSFTSSPLTS